MPQSTHETIAIPLMKSALVTGIACLQFGHLYCLAGVISATGQNPVPYLPCILHFLPAFQQCILANYTTRGKVNPFFFLDMSF